MFCVTCQVQIVYFLSSKCIVSKTITHSNLKLCRFIGHDVEGTGKHFV